MVVRGVLLESSGQRLEILLNILQCKSQLSPPPKQNGNSGKIEKFCIRYKRESHAFVSISYPPRTLTLI